MTDTSKYIGVLAKVMKNKNTLDTVVDKEKYNKLYNKIHSDLNSQLHKSLYPFTSDIVKKCEDMMNDIESLFICPEIVGKRCLLISNYCTTDIFSIYNQLFEDKELLAFMSKIKTQIPLVVVNSEDENNIEVLNYANVRIKMSANELKYLIIESGKRKIAINKVVQYICIKTRLSKDDICVISDNIYGVAENAFGRALSQKLANIDCDGVKTIKKRHLDGFAALIMSDSVMNDTIDNSYVRKYSTITYDQIDDFVNANVKPVLYGFKDEFMSVSTQIMDYYEEQIIRVKATLQDLVGDIVRLGGNEDLTLQSIREIEKNKEKKLKTESKELSETLKDIEEIIEQICGDLGDDYITGKQISRSVLDDIFESIFRCKKFSYGMGKSLLSRLDSFGYDNYDLVSIYVQAVSGKKISFQAIEIEKNEWEKAKMLLYVLEPDNIPIQKLQLYVNALGERCLSGKELYAKALISSERNKNSILQESLDKGYSKAGLMLLEKYKEGDSHVYLPSLANALIPEACMLMSDQKVERCKDKKGRAKISDNSFAYYKIAAAKQYLPAIGKIVDIVFESRFSSGYQIAKGESNKAMVDNGHVICQLCQFLIGKMYQVDHYSEVLGIVLFSLNENLSESMSLLTNAESPLAYYCKGIMYEFGRGVAIDLEKAISNYQMAISKGFVERSEKRLASCKKKKSLYDYEQNSNDNYQSTRDYQSSRTRTSSYVENDGCFAPGTQILMSNGMVKKVEDIKIGDKVFVYDHFKGSIGEEIIVANVHESSSMREYSVISLKFERDIVLSIVKSHALYDMTDNLYVWVDDSNAKKYIGHKFAFLNNDHIEECELLSYHVEEKYTNYYMPLSKYHLNLFAEGILTMPPTKLTVNMFNIDSNMKYNLDIVKETGITPYKEIKDMVSIEEYSVLPCEYLNCVLKLKNCTITDFEYAMNLFREQDKYKNQVG